ncbi:MAG TPA: PKD domain-containing protein, partial [Flavobacteriales bacterium]|nr:PKD domain-containing protein [Flavobacteriales bacterium]
MMLLGDPARPAGNRNWLRWKALLVLLALPLLVAAQEICDNGIDDDGNGLIDLNDTLACPCVLLPPTTNLIANGSFEDHDCCPEGVAQYFDCATGWMDYMASSTAEYFNCDYVPPAVPQPIPDGTGVIGTAIFTDWDHNNSFYEYIMTCLSAPMTAGETHELRFNIAGARISNFGVPAHPPFNLGPINLAVYGLASCPAGPYTFFDQWGNFTPATLCATELGWTELGQVTYQPVLSWQEIAFSFTPGFDVQAIMFGPTCPVPTDYISSQGTMPYFFFDDMSLSQVSLAVNSTGSLCANNLVLTGAPYDNTVNQYQWYRDGIAIVGQTGETLSVSALGLGSGTYTLRMIRPDGSCAMVELEFAALDPVPLVGATPTSGCAPLPVHFSNQTDPALSGPLLWDLGDGSTNTATTFTHTYTQPGTYDVRLTVTSAQGCTADSLFQGLITVHPKPVAAFQADTTYGCAGLPVTFTS